MDEPLPPQIPPIPDAGPNRPRRPIAKAVAALIGGLALGAFATTAVQRYHADTVFDRVGSAASAPAATSPTTTAPSSPDTTQSNPYQSQSRRPRLPSANTPPDATPSAPSAGSSAGSGSVSTAGLTTGLVNIDTKLGYDNAAAAGTGIVISSDGRVLTNNHVIEGSTAIQVTVVSTGKTYKASVVATAPADDVALLQLSGASGLAVAPLGDSSTVKIGDAVVGIGNAGGTGTPTTAPGAVVALDQTITATDETGANPETLHGLIQISAPLQPGESGGPLYSSGKVIGIDTAGSAASVRFRINGPSSEGYAIPIDTALAVVKRMDAHDTSGGITYGTPPFLGVSAIKTPAGVTLTNVIADTPAAALGLKVGDVITSVGGATVATQSDLSAQLRAHAVGEKVTITWTSAGTTHTGTTTLIAGPAD